VSVQVCRTGEALAGLAADRVGEALIAAARRDGGASLVLAGGGTPRGLYRTWARRHQDGAQPPVPWRQIELFWGDERAVPPAHPDSNFGMVQESLLEGVPVPDARIHRIPGELGAEAAARRYEAALRARFSGELPGFDVVLLGMGADGHTASLFPGDASADDTPRWVVATAVHDGLPRVSLTLPVLAAAGQLVFLVAGADKAPALARALAGDPAIPAGRLQRRRPDSHWLVDEDAAREWQAASADGP